MNKKIILFFVFLNIIFIPVSRAEVVDKVLAIVNDELITQSELDRALGPIYKQCQAAYGGDELMSKLEEARKYILNQLIGDKLVLSKAKKLKIEIDPADIQKRIDELKSKFASEEAFNSVLIEEGVTVDDLKKRFQNDLIKEKFIQSEVIKNILITPGQIDDYYNKHRDDFKLPAQVYLKAITIKPRENEDKEAARKRADEALGRIKAGQSFSEVAAAYSDSVYAENGGDMGFVARGQLKENLDNIVFSLDLDKVSDVIEDDLGFYIFLALERKDESMVTVKDAYDRIRNVVFKEELQKKLTETVEGLKKDAYISIK